MKVEDLLPLAREGVDLAFGAKPLALGGTDLVLPGLPDDGGKECLELRIEADGLDARETRQGCAHQK